MPQPAQKTGRRRAGLFVLGVCTRDGENVCHSRRSVREGEHFCQVNRRRQSCLISPRREASPSPVSAPKLVTLLSENGLASRFQILRRRAMGWRRIIALDTMNELARMNEEDKSSARPAIILALLAILVGVFCIEFGAQTLTWFEAKQWASANPWAANVPQPLPLAADDASAGAQVKGFNYEFNLPWKRPKSVESLTSVEFKYESGQAVVFFDPDSQLDAIHTLKTSNPIEYQKFENVFASQPIESNYALYQAVYEASPAQFSPIMKVEEARRDNVLLLWKLSFGPDLESIGAPDFYSFDWGKIRGFQFGDPSKGQPVALRVFDDSNRQFRFIFTVAYGSGGKISQSDINMAVRSLQPVPIIER
jgi:hypothetical protein